MVQNFSPSEAALSVISLARRQAQFVMRFCLIFSTTMLISLALMTVTGVNEALSRYVGLTATGRVPSPEAVRELLGPILPWLGLLVVVNLIVNALVGGLALRKTVLDQEHGQFGLQFGRDEINLFAGGVVYLATIFLVALGFSIVAGLVSGRHSALGGLALLGLVAGVITVSLRMGQFGVLSIAHRGEVGLGLRASFQQTDRRFWHYMGAYVLWTVIVVFASTIVQAVASLGALAMGTKIGTGIPQSLNDMASAGWLFYILVYGMATGFFNLGYYCIGAYAWHQSRGDLSPPQADQLIDQNQP
ncbi:hypothetical protein [Candidatus Phycosocius spiralis]|uniref:Uncharacterized protein n=1 Tax=Candidatus Phycosocius spiralis TaxID=2815099 RepID=A0ABQ4PX19_9PROT|nr:hypothetical protein [Candidatus Phycosocius spiralis]GIU67542.1 hypothetical protein PsB1_1696 [Candidatus Phycosocius spiralis]